MSKEFLSFKLTVKSERKAIIKEFICLLEERARIVCVKVSPSLATSLFSWYHRAEVSSCLVGPHPGVVSGEIERGLRHFFLQRLMREEHSPRSSDDFLSLAAFELWLKLSFELEPKYFGLWRASSSILLWARALNRQWWFEPTEP